MAYTMDSVAVYNIKDGSDQELIQLDPNLRQQYPKGWLVVLGLMAL